MMSIIAAIGQNRELGKDNKLLWHIPEDLKRFKQLTLGHPIIMGRKTFESIGKPLPGRINIVISRSLTRPRLARLSGVLVVDSLEKAIEKASHVILSTFDKLSVNSAKDLDSSSRQGGTQNDNGDREIFVIGGGQIFQQALPLVNRLYLTIVDAEFEADTFFPDYSDFKKIIFEQKGESGQYKYTFLDLERN